MMPVDMRSINAQCTHQDRHAGRYRPDIRSSAFKVISATLIHRSARCLALASGSLAESQPSPRRLGRIHQLEIDRRDPKQRYDGGFFNVRYNSIIVRRARRAPDKSSSRNRDRVSWIEINATVHPPRTRKNDRQSISRIGVRCAHVSRIPFHEHQPHRDLACSSRRTTWPLLRCEAEIPRSRNPTQSHQEE
jgi:hypothetical protein